MVNPLFIIHLRDCFINMIFSNGLAKEINTGFARNNNNDHVLSFDGKMIGISNHVGDKRTSTIYTLPVTGSDNPLRSHRKIRVILIFMAGHRMGKN